jgi:hypothetical protein
MSWLQPKDDVGEWSLRLSIAAVFLFASVNKVTAPENGQIFEALLGVGSPALVFGTGLALIISSLMLIRLWEAYRRWLRHLVFSCEFLQRIDSWRANVHRWPGHLERCRLARS